MSKILCVYHANCADGFAAAWVVRKWAALVKTPIEFLPAIYGKTPIPQVDKDTCVYIVDFSFGVEDTMKLMGQAYEVIILDHHKTAFERLVSLEGEQFTKVFDVNRSGAMIAWDYFFPGQAAPELLWHIQDRDLWKFEFSETRPIQANLFSYPYDFAVWDNLMNMGPSGCRSFALEGEAIERKHFKDIREFLNVSCKWIRLAGVDMPATNVPYMWGSDAAHILAENAINKCAAYYYDTADSRVYGLRSVGDRDVSVIAKHYGGGGHMHAAGFSIPLDPAADPFHCYVNSVAHDQTK